MPLRLSLPKNLVAARFSLKSYYVYTFLRVQYLYTHTHTHTHSAFSSSFSFVGLVPRILLLPFDKVGSLLFSRKSSRVLSSFSIEIIFIKKKEKECVRSVRVSDRVLPPLRLKAASWLYALPVSRHRGVYSCSAKGFFVGLIIGFIISLEVVHAVVVLSHPGEGFSNLKVERSPPSANGGTKVDHDVLHGLDVDRHSRARNPPQANGENTERDVGKSARREREREGKIARRAARADAWEDSKSAKRTPPRESDDSNEEEEGRGGHKRRRGKSFCTREQKSQERRETSEEQ